MRSVILFAAVLVVGPAAPEGPERQVETLSWMAGGWASEREGSLSEEHWLAPRGGTMLGLHRDVEAGRTTGFEFLRIEARPDGLVYVASPGGRPPTTFRAVEISGERVVFENKGHDFPQRILYWKADGALHARIEGIQEGRAQSLQWRWPAAPPYGRESSDRR